MARGSGGGGAESGGNSGLPLKPSSSRAPLAAAPVPAAAPRPHLGRPCALGGSAAPAPPPPPQLPGRRVDPGLAWVSDSPASPPPPPPDSAWDCSATGLDVPGPAVAPLWCGGGGGGCSCSPDPARSAEPRVSPAGPGSGAPAGAEAGAAQPGSGAPTPPPPAPPPPPPPPPVARGPKAARLKRMVRLAAELLLLLGLLLLTLHITVLRGSGAADRPDVAAGNVSGSQLQVSAPPEGACVVARSWEAGEVLARRRVLCSAKELLCLGNSAKAEAASGLDDGAVAGGGVGAVMCGDQACCKVCYLKHSLDLSLARHQEGVLGLGYPRPDGGCFVSGCFQRLSNMTGGKEG